MNEQTIGIIGGLGIMGRAFTQLFQEDNLQVLCSDINTELTNQELVRQSDIIIISVPIDQTIPVIQEIGEALTEKQLLMDFTSIKTEPIEAMLQTKADVIGMHPMFSPPMDSLTNQTIVLTPIRDRRGWLSLVLDYFQKKGFKLQITSPERHDEIMGLIQVLIHFNLMTLGITLSRLEIDLSEALEYTSPTFQIELDLIGRIFTQSSELYGTIPMRNPFTRQILEQHTKTLDTLREIILKKDSESFKELFEKTSDYFQPFKTKALAESSYLFSQLVEFNGKQ
ncbi:MAG: prephenate dehydrogenase/arogenate dehydrogenase family protein [Candidatus Heimdallarchaeota archaeon]|nr:prephenate dehydrogenase/arogenate dehydrogenase family protein [Candidatus Heimdallarchaeota archaeon]